MFLADILPFALTALGVMTVTHLLTMGIDNIWLLLLTRVVTAALLYYLVMRLAGATILKECLAFIRKKKL
jgi:hypothetical protein